MCWLQEEKEEDTIMLVVGKKIWCLELDVHVFGERQIDLGQNEIVLSDLLNH